MEEDFYMTCQEALDFVDTENLDDVALYGQGVFQRLNTMSKMANDMMCTEECPCQLKIVLANDFDYGYLLKDLHSGGNRMLNEESIRLGDPSEHENLSEAFDNSSIEPTPPKPSNNN